MLKYFLFCVFFLTLSWQAFGEEPIVEPEIEEDNNLDVPDFNDTAEITHPQPRFAQLSVNGKIYTLYFQRINWHAAVELCNSQNQDITTITSQVESNNLYTYLIQYNLQQSDSAFWLGASDLANPGQWSWINNGYPLMFSKWRYGAPTNSYSQGHCLELLSSGDWNANHCEKSNAVVCQKRVGC